MKKVYFSLVYFRKAVESDTTVDEKRLMQQLEKRLVGQSVAKEEDALYGELMAANLRKLSSDNNLVVKHEIYNVMLRHLYAQRQQEMVVQQLPALNTPTHAESPSHAIYQQSGFNIQGSPYGFRKIWQMKALCSTSIIPS